jgi:DNA-nicking Smr family endonuclease
MNPIAIPPIAVPIEDVLDLHTFAAKEVAGLLQDYLELCREKGILEVRIIHGKGQGIQRARVRRLLAANAVVLAFREAPCERGGWGATLVILAPLTGNSHIS